MTGHTHLEDLAAELRARTEPDGRQSWPSATWGRAARAPIEVRWQQPLDDAGCLTIDPPRMTAQQRGTVQAVIDDLADWLRRQP